MLVQQLGASERHLGYLLLHDFVGEEVRHPVDECEPQIVCREVAGSEQLQVGVCICAGERDVRRAGEAVVAGSSPRRMPVVAASRYSDAVQELGDDDAFDLIAEPLRSGGRPDLVAELREDLGLQ